MTFPKRYSDISTILHINCTEIACVNPTKHIILCAISRTAYVTLKNDSFITYSSNMVSKMLFTFFPVFPWLNFNFQDNLQVPIPCIMLTTSYIDGELLYDIHLLNCVWEHFMTLQPPHDHISWVFLTWKTKLQFCKFSRTQKNPVDAYMPLCSVLLTNYVCTRIITTWHHNIMFVDNLVDQVKSTMPKVRGSSLAWQIGFYQNEPDIDKLTLYS